MKKLVLAVALVVTAAAVFAGGVGAATPGGTVVNEGFACGVLDGNGDVFITYNSTLTLYDSGKVVLQCSGNNGVPPPGPPFPTYFNNGNTDLSCGMLDYGSTDQWRDKVGYNGDSQLTCTTFVKNNSMSSAGAGIG